MPNWDPRMTSNRSWSIISNAALRSNATSAVTSFKISLINFRSRVSVERLLDNYSGIGVADLGCTGVPEFEEGQHFPVILI